MPVCLGLDYGLRRIGIAAGDTERRIAFAVTTHVEGRDGPVLDLLRRLAAERGTERIVVGLPLTADGRETDMAVRARRFAGVLERELGLAVVLWDERFSSAEADRWLPAGRRTAKEERDALAAEIILQSYLDSLAAGRDGAGPAADDGEPRT